MVVLLVVKITRGSTTVEPPPVAPASSGVVQAASSVPGAVFDAVGAQQTVDPGEAVLSGQPPLSIGGRPAVVYVGAEFCPYCAAERWALVAALGRFGTFTHLGATTSSDAEVFPGTATFTFDGTVYRSRYVTFAAVEEYGARPSTTAPAGFPKLRDPTPVEWALVRRYDTEPFVPGNGTFPFVDVDNRLVVSGSGIGFSPGVLAGQVDGPDRRRSLPPVELRHPGDPGGGQQAVGGDLRRHGRATGVGVHVGRASGRGRAASACPDAPSGRARRQPARRWRTCLRSFSFSPPQMPWGSRIRMAYSRQSVLHDATRANLLGAVLPLDLVFFALGVRGRKEDRRLRSPAGRPSLPSLPQRSSLHSPS